MRERSAADPAAVLSFPPQEETETGVDIVAQPIASINPEKFIPVDRNDIVQRVLDKCFEPDQRELAEEVVRYMCALRQVESARLLDSLVEAYDAFNPDDETVNDRAIVGAERRAHLERLKAMVIDLVESANYLEIDNATLEKLLEEENYAGFGAEVDLHEYDFHLLYYRGEIKDKIYVRPWKTLWLRKREVNVDAYRRLFIGLKLKPFAQRVAEIMKSKGISRKKAEKLVKRARSQQMLEGVSENTLHLKIFRRIARTELEILFPEREDPVHAFRQDLALGRVRGQHYFRYRHGGAEIRGGCRHQPFLCHLHDSGCDRRNYSRHHELLQHAHPLYGEARQKPLFP